jgi:hypothetical protein
MVSSVTKGRTHGDFYHQGQDTEFAKKLRVSKHTDMTIHWKALEEHFLMVPLDSSIFGDAFSEFF